MNAIETDQLTKFYGQTRAVHDLTLEINNEIFGLLGPNGSGKTTTVLMLTTLLAPTSGTGSVCGYDIVTEGDKVRKKISYVPQEMAVDIKLTGRENVDFFAKLYGVRDRRNRVKEVLEVMELSDRADDRAGTYSGGMRRRLELAQALVHEPEVLFLDEPTIGLDVAARKKIWDHIIALKKNGMTIFVTTHYMDEADHSCDRVGIISHGTLAVVDSPSNLKSNLMKDVITARIEGEFHDPNLEGVTFIGKVDDEISFMAENGSEALPILAHSLSVSGVKVHALTLHEPTLDDVFLHAVGTVEEPGAFDFNRFRLMLRRRK